ncbi:AMP-binding protein [Dactylosporangium sp. CA-092794]|uniref:AMP-binding protein n=1 Tax=Dactylosporangium sp. CA-092794 TaxID=3239929 RepID=UPI003D94B34B
MTNAVAAIWAHAAAAPDRPAVRTPEITWSYGELVRRSAAFADRLARAGIDAGDRVLLCAPTEPGFVAAYLGILARGAVAVTVNTQCAPAELEYFLRDAGCALAVAHAEVTGRLGPAAEATGTPLWTLPLAEAPPGGDVLPAERADDDLAVLLYTSGTTGRPKGAMLGHGNLSAAADAYCGLLSITAEDRIGTALPLFHVFGQVGVLLTALRAGAGMSLLRPFSAAGLLAMAAGHRLTMVSGVPTMWLEMLHATTGVGREELAGLRAACSGGAAMPLEVARAFRDRFGPEILDGYGLSETASAGALRDPAWPAKEGSVGPAVPGLRLAILDDGGEPLPSGAVGEVAIHGPAVGQGYWGRPQDTAEVLRDGWFRTGDLGRMDDEGYLWIVDRKKDMIIRGGYNVYPREVEEALYEHPEVREAAVIGVPDPRLGEEVAAVLVVAGPVDPDGLRAWLEERLAVYKVPRLYHFVDALPRGATGKLLKRDIDRSAVLTRARRAHRPARPATN